MTRRRSGVEEEMERVAVDCKRACLDYRSCLGRNFFEEGVEVEVSGDEGACESLCERSDGVSVMMSLVDLVYDSVSFGESDFEPNVPQNLSVSRQRSNCIVLESSTRKRRQAWTRHQSSRHLCPKGRHSKRCVRMSGTGRHMLQICKGARHC